MYDERVKQFHKIEEILSKRDSDITPQDCFNVVDADILNFKAQNELLSYQSTGKFLFEHSIVREWFSDIRLYEYYRDIKKTKPELLIKEITNLTQNIRRIKSAIKTKKYKDETTLSNWQDNLKMLELRNYIISQILPE